MLRSLLEVGCSLGNTLEAASRKGLDHLGIDVSSFAVSYCQDRGLNASTETMQDLIDKKEVFDLILMQHVLEHFQDPFTILKQANQLLAPGGLVQVLIPNSNYLSAKRLRDRHRFYSKSGVGIEHYVYFNYRNLSRALASCGFRTIQSNYPFWVNHGSLNSFIKLGIGPISVWILRIRAMGSERGAPGSFQESNGGLFLARNCEGPNCGPRCPLRTPRKSKRRSKPRPIALTSPTFL